jgi:riboflavin kinase/FMN adenylyltransferase
MLINRSIEIAKEKDYYSSVITFFPNPHLLFGSDNSLVNFMDVTPMRNKLDIFEEMGIDIVFVVNLLNFRGVGAQNYITEFLEKINIGHLVIGYDNSFGKNNAGNIDTIESLIGDSMDYTVCEPFLVDGHKVSTTRIKEHIVNGDYEEVKRLLGRNFTIKGRVFEGRRLGRTIGFPTANVYLGEDQFKPGNGVYATYAYVRGKKYNAMTNVGVNPTVSEDSNTKIEVHLIDADVEIYHYQIEVEFISKVRDEVKFSDVEALKAQLEKDKENIKKLLLT